MNLHEYQGKEILKTYGVKVPAGIMVDNAGEAENAALKIKNICGREGWVVKAQIHAGGRGKGGGVKPAATIDEVNLYARNILGMQLITPQTGETGKKVRKILIEQGIYYPGTEEIKEFYISILLDRKTSVNNILYSPRGGMDIETVAGETPELIFREEIDPAFGIQSFQMKKIAFNLGLSGNAFREMTKFIRSVYEAYIACDATLLEINPVIKTSDNQIFAADTKISLDDSALYRHPDYIEMKDAAEEDASETEAAKYNLNFIKLSGNVGCMVNGAGLAMATMDMIKLAGGEPANFLDVGGSASADTVEAGFRIILKDKDVKAILINIFGGIVRCDRVALGITEACKLIGNIRIPVIVRLQGTNAEEARQIISESGLKVSTATTLAEAAQMVKTRLT